VNRAPFVMRARLFIGPIASCLLAIAPVALYLNRFFRTFGAASNKKLRTNELTYPSQQLGCSSGKA
jgi:hypothetical protein